MPFIRFEGYWLKENYKKFNKFNSNSVSFFPDINFNQVDNYLKEDINHEIFLNYFNKCIEKLKNIEKESDIKFFDYFLDNHLEYPFFRDNYHPTMNMLEVVGKNILETINKRFKLKISDRKIKLKKNTREWGHYKPIKNEVKKILKIQYDLDNIFLCSRKIYLQDIIKYENNINNDFINDLDEMKKKNVLNL